VQRRSTLTLALGALALASACADPCLDDGLGQSKCPAAGTETAGGTDSETDSASASASITDSDSSASASASDSSASASASATDSDSDSDSDSDTDGTLWCLDADGDGFGDPDDCTNEPGDGRVPNGDDCDDGSADTYPGAAYNEDAEACRKDSDGDGYGDGDPPDGVDPGGDCDDDDASAFPGAAFEEDREACMRDADGDGWGDSMPGGDIEPGADCYDSNPALNPGTLELTALVGNDLVTVGLDGTLTVRMPIDIPVAPPNSWVPVSAAIDIEGTLWVTDNAADGLATVDYASVCDGTNASAPMTRADMDHDLETICGISFGRDGELYGLHTASNSLVMFDLTTGTMSSSEVVTEDGNPLFVGSCGLSYDCHTGNLLWASGANGDVYSIDHETAVATRIADTPGSWTPTGAAYDPVGRQLYVSRSTELLRVQLDASDDFETLGTMAFDGGGAVQVSNIEYLPLCPE
jgi:hypothetical protein